MIIPRVGIVPNYVLNNTRYGWFEFQDILQEGLKTSLHILPHEGEFEILMKSQKHPKFENLYFEIWVRLENFKLDVIILKSQESDAVEVCDG